MRRQSQDRPEWTVLREAADLIERSPDDSIAATLAVEYLRDVADVHEERGATTPCPEGFHFIGQTARHCDKCGLPAWEHAGTAKLSRPMRDPFDKVPWVLDPWKPGEAERIRQRWSTNDDQAVAGQCPPTPAQA